MAFVPYMAAGFAVDKLMGGDGIKGALMGAGGSFLPGMLASGAGAAATTGAATAAASNTMPLLMTNSAALGGSGLGATMGAGALEGFGAVNPLTTGGFAESISPFTQLGIEGGIQGVNTGLFGQEISKQGLDSALNPRFLGGALDNSLLGDGLKYVGQGKDYIDEGWDNMSTSDKISTGTGVVGAVDNVTQAPPPIQHQQIQQVVAKAPSPREPFVTQMQIPGGIPVASISEEDRRRANRYSSLLG